MLTHAPTTVVAGCADEAYAAPACVALMSAAASTPEPLPVLFLDAGCTEPTLERMRGAFERHRIPLTVLSVADALADLHEEAYFSRATYGSLIAPRLAAAHAERTLFLDCDTVTLGSIEELVATDLRGFAVGAVQDERLRYVSSARGVPDWVERGLPPAAAYFNAGVLLIDNAAWLERRIGEQALALVRETGASIPIVEQGALNTLLAGLWWPLEPRWNSWVRPALALKVGDVVVTRRDARRLPDSLILHFIDRWKPWQPDYPPSIYRRLYLRAQRRLVPEFAAPEHWSLARWTLERRRMSKAWARGRA